MIGNDTFPIRSYVDATAGNGWSIVGDGGHVASDHSHGVIHALGKTTADCEAQEADAASHQGATSPPSDSVLGKKRKLDSVEDMQGLRNQTFNDITAVESEGAQFERPSMANMDRFNAIRTTADVPAEGAGLRGEDMPVDEIAREAGDEDQFKQLTFSAPKKLCIRHLRMADEGTTARLQKSIDSLPLADQTAVNTVWSLFSSSPHPRRALILQGILTMCCFSQLSLLSTELSLAIRIDPFSLFPREVSLKVLRYIDAMSLGRAAQVSRTWKALADDDLLWRNMCEQHIERKCEKCGWGLPLLNEKRRRVKRTLQPGSAESRQLTYVASTSPSSPGSNQGGSLKKTVTAAANAAAQEKNAKSGAASRMSSPAPGATVPTPAPSTTATRPWKSVYCERLAIERNWRKGRYTTKVLSGHTDGIMCLQFSESLTHPNFPIVITGSYDRTARIWNMETGEELRVLKGHTRGVRCLQFDEAKLITGSMDRTLKIWNWRTGELMRTLEGHTQGIVCLNFNNDILASGSADSNIKIWNFRTGECYTLRGHSDWVNAVSLWSAKATTNKIDWHRGQMQDQGSRSQASKAELDNSANTFLFSASDDGTIRLWDLQARECLMSYDGHVGQVQSIKLVMLDDEAVRKLSANAGGGTGADHAETIQRNELRAQRNTQSAASAAVHDATHSASSYFVYPEGSNRTTGAATRGETDDEEEDDETGAPAADSAQTTPGICGYNPPAVPGGRAANTGSAPAIPSRFTYRTAREGSARSEANKAADRERDRIFNSRKTDIDETLLRLQSRLCQAGLVAPLPIDAELADLEGPLAADWVPSKDKTKDHHQTQRPVLISGSLDNTIRLWCVRTGRCIRTLFGHTEGIWSLSLDKLRIASASHDRCIKTWDTDSGTCKQTFVGHRGAVTCVQLGDDKIVSGSDDGDCRIWSFAPA